MADAVYKTSGRKGTQQNCDHLARLFAARGIAEHLVCLLIQVTESAICFGGRTTFVAAVYFRKKKNNSHKNGNMFALSGIFYSRTALASVL